MGVVLIIVNFSQIFFNLARPLSSTKIFVNVLLVLSVQVTFIVNEMCV